MTNEQINIAIAEHCGWEPRKNTEGNVIAWQSLGAYRAFSPDDLPNYCNDLNAMHEAVMTLPENKRVLYGMYLACECGHMDKNKVGLWNISTATARHQAKAFLRTLGIKWKEGGE